jgi:hypothetical protein
MLALVTVLAAFLAYYVNWIQQRHEFLNQSQATWDAGDTTIGGSSADPIKIMVRSSIVAGPYRRARRAPLLLWFFGETGYWVVNLLLDGPTKDNLTETDYQKINEAKRLFPESGIIGMHFSQDGEAWEKTFVEMHDGS